MWIESHEKCLSIQTIEVNVYSDILTFTTKNIWSDLHSIVLDELEMYEIGSEKVPGPIHHLIMPNDNYYHSHLKRIWRTQSLAARPYSAMTKYKALQVAINGITSSTVECTFRRCGLLECTPSTQATKLMSEGVYGESARSRQKSKYHEDCEKCYLAFRKIWKSAQNSDGGLSPAEAPVQLGEQGLDSAYWQNIPQDLINSHCLVQHFKFLDTGWKPGAS